MHWDIHTDLALEQKEMREQEDGAMKGISFEEAVEMDEAVKITTVKVLNDKGAQALGREMGTYITMEIPDVHRMDKAMHRRLAECLSECIRRLPVWNRRRILLVGIGNREITSDSLGPACINETVVNRHFRVINREEDKYSISAIAPGVMAQTGMESVEIIRGVIGETKPELVIAVDALAARSIGRVNTTIQVCDTGITPGSGLGNHRISLREDTLGIPCIAIGVPTVVSAATIVGDVLTEFSRQENVEALKQEVWQRIPEAYGNLFVTTKNVDEEVQCLSRIISHAIEICYEATEE